MSAIKKVLIQFAKRPQAGFVKTRLATSIGNIEAMSVHKSLVKAVNMIAQRTNGAVRVLAWGQDHLDEPLVDHLKHHEEFYQSLTCEQEIVQSNTDLGHRMYDAFCQFLDVSEVNDCKVVIVGSDCPSLKPTYIEQAFDVLSEADLVLGPAEDGGYVLIGATIMDRKLFSDVEWGSSKVLGQTLSNANDLNYKTKLLDTLWDVDTLSDLQRWQTQASHNHS